MTGLDMQGHIDDVFKSAVVTRTSSNGSYVNGIWVNNTQTTSNFNANVQPVSTRDIEVLNIGGERVVDHRTIYINSGDLTIIKLDDKWLISNVPGVFKTVKMDVRSQRNYCKIIVVLEDE